MDRIKRISLQLQGSSNEVGLCIFAHILNEFFVMLIPYQGMFFRILNIEPTFIEFEIF